MKKVVLVIVSFLLTTCKKDHLLDCFKSTGSETTESRDASAFTEINLINNVDLKIKPNSGFYIKVTAGENILDGIITEISGNTLFIRNENKCNWVRSFNKTISVEVGMDNPVLIHYEGSGNIECLDTITSDEFTFDSFNGSGTINLLVNCSKVHLRNHIGRSDIIPKGHAVESYIYANDVGIYDGRNLSTSFTTIRSSSTGDSYVNASASLSYEISYTGNIYFNGNPVIDIIGHTGTGKLIHY